MRLFTAVYPSAEAQAHLDLALGGVGGPSVADPGAGLRWIAREQRHVTLSFHGEVPDGAVEEYSGALATAVADLGPFGLALAGSGTFGGRTLWLGLAGDTEPLRRLAAVVTRVGEESGVRAQDRAGGRPHLTVARASASRVGADRARRRRGSRAASSGAGSPFAHWAHALAVYRGPVWEVGQLHVVASDLGSGRSGGPAHTDVAVIPLGGPE